MSTADSVSAVQETFLARAAGYAAETNWVQDGRLISPLLPGGSPSVSSNLLLDLCAGTGAVSLYASLRGWRVHALDVTSSMLSRIEAPDIVRSVGDATRTAFLDRSFDVVTMRQALHYLECDSAIREMLRLSRRFISLGQITLWRSSDREVWERYFSVASPGRRHVFAPGEIAKLIRRAGGQIVADVVRESRERFAGPVSHLGDEVASALGEQFLAASPSFRRAHKLAGNDWRSMEMSLRWEFLRVAVSM